MVLSHLHSTRPFPGRLQCGGRLVHVKDDEQNATNLISRHKHRGFFIGLLPQLLILLHRLFSGTEAAAGGDNDAAGGWMCDSVFL